MNRFVRATLAPRVVRALCAVVAAVVVLIVSLLATSARADTVPPTAAGEAAPQPETYALHILAADAASVGVIAASGLLDAEDLAYVGVGGLVLGGPVVHAAHGNWGRSAMSLGLRVVLPIVGASIGASMADCRRDEFLCGLSEIGLGYMVGTAAAITVDAAVLARWSAIEGSRDHQAEPASRPRTPGMTVAPRVVATPSLALIGVGGSFL